MLNLYYTGGELILYIELHKMLTPFLLSMWCLLLQQCGSLATVFPLTTPATKSILPVNCRCVRTEDKLTMNYCSTTPLLHVTFECLSWHDVIIWLLYNGTRFLWGGLGSPVVTTALRKGGSYRKWAVSVLYFHVCSLSQFWLYRPILYVLICMQLLGSSSSNSFCWWRF